MLEVEVELVLELREVGEEVQVVDSLQRKVEQLISLSEGGPGQGQE